MFEVPVSLIIKSHLNDSMIEIQSNPELAQSRLEFVKYLIHMFPDTDVEIDPKVVHKQFKLGHAK
jgi:hypothetical protein